MEYNIKVELWLASQEITSSRLRSNTKETTSDGVQKNVTKENVEEAPDGSYLNNSDCISSTTVQQEEASHDDVKNRLNHVEDAKNRLNLVGPSCSTEAVVSSTTFTPSCQTEKSKDI